MCFSAREEYYFFLAAGFFLATAFLAAGFLAAVFFLAAFFAMCGCSYLGL